jgi:DNA-binding transcriptional MocR family regulator
MKEYAIPNDIIYVPGAAFYPITGYKLIDNGTDIEPSKPEINTMRLGFSYATRTNISAGIEKLGALLSENI